MNCGRFSGLRQKAAQIQIFNLKLEFVFGRHGAHRRRQAGWHVPSLRSKGVTQAAWASLRGVRKFFASVSMQAASPLMPFSWHPCSTVIDGAARATLETSASATMNVTFGKFGIRIPF